MSKLDSTSNQFGRAIAFSALICAVVFTGCIVLRSKGELEPLEFWAYDQLARHRGYGPDPGNVVLVGVDESDIHALGHYPLDDEDKAGLIAVWLEGFKARVIGWDIYMDLPVKKEGGTTQPTTLGTTSGLEGISGPERLKEQLIKNRNVICAEAWGDAKFNEPDIPPPSYLARGRRVGFVDQVLDRDGSVRRGLLYLSFKRDGSGAGSQGSGAEPSLSLNVANKFLEGTGALKPDKDDLIHIDRFWSQRIPRLHSREGPYGDDVEKGGYQYLVKYDGPDHFETYTLQDVMVRMDDAAGQKAFGGKAVIIGMTAESVKDKINTPVRSEQWGAEQHVRLVDELIQIAGGAGPLRSLAWKKGLVWTFLWTVLAGVFGHRLRYAGHLSIVAFVGVAVIGLIAWSCARNDLLIPVMPPLICWLLSLAGVTAWRSPSNKER